MKPVASCRVGRNPIIEGREIPHTNYSAIIPDPNPPQFQLVKDYITGNQEFANSRKKRYTRLPSIKKESAKLHKAFNCVLAIIYRALPKNS